MMEGNSYSTVVVLVRHGESVGNTTGRHQGQVDTGLSERGREQARLVAERLRNEPIDALYSSDLRRATETAAYIGAVLGLETRTDPRLREIDVGAWEHLTTAEIAERFPDEWERYLCREDVHRGGAENMHDVRLRSEEALREIVARHRGQMVCVVCHGGVIFSLVAHWLGMSLRDAYEQLLDPRNTAVTVVEFHGDQIKVLSHADASHVPTNFLVMRHGRTEWNEAGRWQGQADTPLDDTGREQARQAGEHLRGAGIERIYSSDLQRAWETASVIGEILGIEPRAHSGLRESDIGAWAGLTTQEIQSNYPEQWQRFVDGDVYLRRGGGETLTELQGRVVATVQEIAAKEAGRNILLVSHGAALRMLMLHALGIELKDRHQVQIGGNTAISKLVLQNGAFTVLDMNDTSHLDAAPESVISE